jgi:hypothetical protein
MRIHDEDHDRKLDKITVFLTKSEARELKSDLNSLLCDPAGNHRHLSSDDYRKEITVCIYDEARLEGFSERAKKLILEDM